MKNIEQFKSKPKTSEKGQIFIPYEEEKGLPNRRSHKNKPKTKKQEYKTDLSSNQIEIDFPSRNGLNRLGLSEEEYFRRRREESDEDREDTYALYNKPYDKSKFSDSENKEQEEIKKNLEKIPPILLDSFNFFENFFKRKTKDSMKLSNNPDIYGDDKNYMGTYNRIKAFKKLLEEGKFEEFYNKWSEMRTDGKFSSSQIVLFDIEKNDGTKIDHYRNILESAKTLIEK